MQIAKYIPVMLASMLKFVGGPLSGIALGLNWIETCVCTIVGMMLSVILVTYAGTALRLLLARFSRTKPRRFTKRTRLAVRIWKRFGIAGIALLTPLLLTPIGGTILALSFKVNRPAILGYMLLSGSFWGLVFTLAAYQVPHLFR